MRVANPSAISSSRARAKRAAASATLSASTTVARISSRAGSPMASGFAKPRSASSASGAVGRHQHRALR